MSLSPRSLPGPFRSRHCKRAARSPTPLAAVCATLIAAGCSSLPQLTAPVASYGSANVFSPSGYGQTKLSDTHYTVRATGTEATPKERVEKIARARAAQIGVEQKLPYYKVGNVQHGQSCTKRQEGYKSEATPASARPTVVLDVVYAREPGDPSFASAAESFAALSAEIAAQVVPPEARAVAIQETRTGCGPQ